jgi:hypothetical protein
MPTNFYATLPGKINSDDTLRFFQEKRGKPTTGQSLENLTLPFEQAYA